MVDVEPDVLVWARESIGLSRDEAAERLDMTETALRFLEVGAADVSLFKLRTMAELYDRPLIAFFLPSPPAEEDDTLPDFRLLPEVQGKAWSRQLHREFRRVVGQRQVALELSDLDDEPVPTIDLHLGIADDTEEAGEAVRGWLNLARLSAAPRRPYEFFNAWVALIEERSVLVTQITGIDTDEMRGFSIGEYPFPMIALNGKDSIRGRTFTLLHELAHVLLRRSALCDLEDDLATHDASAQRVEWFCNAVAAAVLMPRDVLLREPIVANAAPSKRWQKEELATLGALFGVSNEAMLLRLVTLGRATREYYRERRTFFRRHRQEETGAGSGNYYRNRIRNLGRRYIRAVLDAYDRDEITDADLSRYLDMKLKNVPSLVEALGSER